jgi:nucleoside-diphosphate-sugar epimerase
MIRNLVTGGSGFLGSHLVEALVTRGEEVRALVRPTSKIDHLKTLEVELFYSDLNDVQSLKKAVQGTERVYHCAALANDWGDRESFYAANVTGVSNILEAALEAGVSKFIHVSTTDVYGYPNAPVDETASFQLRGWHYGDTKIEGERLVWSYYKNHGLPITVVRPVSIYGPRSESLVIDIVELLKNSDMVHMGNGKTPAGLAYVTNVVDLILLAADSEKSVGQAYNVSDGSDITWCQYVNRLAEIGGMKSPRIVIPYRIAYFTGWMMEKVYGSLKVKSRPLLTRMAVELFCTDQGFSINKARQELGYEPKVLFEEGIKNTEDWLRKSGLIK